MMTDAVALAKERSAAKTAGFWYGVAVFLKYFSLIFVAFMMLLPLVSCFVTAAKTDKEYQSTSVMDMPKNWFNFDNYVQAFVASNMAVAFRNSIIVVVVVLVVTTIIGTMLAYVLSRFQFPGNGLIRGMFALASRAVQDDGQLPRRQHDVGLHCDDVRHRRDLHLRVHPVLREHLDLPG